MSNTKKNGKSSSKVTIIEVARKAGVSVMTVSRVMRNHGSIAKETRELVLKTIDEMGYIPLQSARNLSSATPRVLGMIIPSSDGLRELRQGYEYEYALLIGALNTCNKHDYSVVIQEFRSNTDIQLLIRRVQSRQIGGYIIAAPASESANLVDTFIEHGITFSTISAYAKHDGFSVAAHEREATYQMTKRLIDLGHRKLAFVGGMQAQRATRERQQGYSQAILERPDLSIDSRIHQCGIFFEDGFREGVNILSQANRPTGIQCLTDDIAAGVIAAANTVGIDLPNGLSLCGFDNFGLARKISPPLTTAVLPAEEMAEVAAMQVINALEQRTQDNQILLDCPVVYRQSSCEAPVKF